MAQVTREEYQKIQDSMRSQFTEDSLNNYRNAYNNYMAQGMSSSDAFNRASGLLVKQGATSNTSTTPKTTQTNTNQTSNQTNNQTTRTSTAQPTNQSNVKTSSYQNQGEGNYVYNQSTGYYEKVNKPNSNQTNNQVNLTDTQRAWDNMTYDQQQERLNNTPGLRDSLVKKGWTIKSPNTQQQQNNTVPANTDGWDYQDNSPERMMQMANNLEMLYQTDPGLFANEQTFRDFFINGKGRTPEQEQFLLDYFKNRQIYNQYDGYPSDKVGNMAAHGQVPDSYLNYLKNTNPVRYQEVMAGKEQEENRIGNNSYYTNLLNQAGFEDSNNIAWQKKEGLLVDANGDLIDDRLYHEPTAEELALVEQNNQYEQERAKLTDAYKWLQEDLTDQYPDADLSTIMVLTSDRGNKIQRALDTLAVNQTKVQGSLKYLQSERQAQDNAGKQTIANLQKQLGMYYSYSPEGMSELAQNQYAATNITLDQADNGTDTQKQMALQSVLDDYYDKYGSIIQRSEQQVINDVMALAKDKGISLSQALEENFLTPLRNKPGFNTLNSVASTPNVFKIGENTYGYWDENGNLVSIGNMGNGSGGGSSFSNYTPITEEQKESALNNFMSANPEGATGGECGAFVNDYLQALGYGRWIGNELSTKTAIKNSDEATKGSIAIMNSSKHPSNGHVAIVTDVQGDKVKLLESNRNDDHKVHTTRWVNKSDIIGYFDPSKEKSTGEGWNPDLETFLDKWRTAEGDRLKEKDFWATFGKDIEDKGVSKEEFLAQYKKYYQYESRDAYLEILSNLDNLIELTGGDFDRTERAAAFSGLGDTGKVFKYIKNNLTVNGLQQARDRGLKLGVLSDSDVKMIAEASAVLDWDVSQSRWDQSLRDFRESLLKNNPYLRQEYENKSAYSNNKGFKYDNNSKSWSIYDINGDEQQGEQQQKPKKGKIITDLGSTL